MSTAKPTGAAASCSANIPDPPTKLHVSTLIRPKGSVLHRIHEDLYAPAAFNLGIKGNARFSPIKDRSVSPEVPIPTLYGGSTFDCAAMETVFHDVPFVPGLKTIDKRKLRGQFHSRLVLTMDLVLADLSATALRKLGVPRNQLIDTEKDCYPQTRKWAEAIHAQARNVQGLCWVSRQDDRARAVVLFGDRVPSGALATAGSSRSLLGDPSAYGELLDLALLIGVSIVGPMP